MAAGFKVATVNASYVPATQSNFPSYVDLSRLGITTLAEAQSVRVYADVSKTTEWAREIVSATEMHVKVPSLTSTTEMYVDWDGVSADYAVTDTYGRNAVWSGVFTDVWHFEANGNDSTSAGKTLSAINAPTIGAEKIGNGFDNGTATNKGYRKTADLMGFTSATQSFSHSIWFQINTHPTGTGVFFIMNRMYGEAAGTQVRMYYANNSGAPKIVLQNDAGGTVINYSVTLSTGVWYHAVFANEAGTTRLSLDGVSVATGTASGTVGYSGYPDEFSVLTDRTSYAGGCSPGSADEVRTIVGNYLSGNWITTEYNNQSDEAGFWGTWSTAGGGGGAVVGSLLTLGVG